MSLAPEGARSLALTMGEPAGIGGEITLKAWHRRDADLPAFFVIDDPERLARLADRIGVDVPVRQITAPEEASAIFPDALPVLPLALAEPPEPGRLSAANQAAVRTAIEIGARQAMEGRAAALVTNPIHKSALYADGFAYPGHTEFLAALGGVERSVMMLASEMLRVVPVTVHMSLSDAIDTLDWKIIVETARIAADALNRDFGIARPRLAVAGLNPHAGEEGALGGEEMLIIAPAIEALKADGIDVFGPVPPDTLFSAAARSGYDAAICMYHDQALIPIKTLDFEGAVNVTLGLPFIRTSPDHGTALDIAGTGTAGEGSLVAALCMADRMARSRARVAA